MSEDNAAAKPSGFTDAELASMWHVMSLLDAVLAHESKRDILGDVSATTLYETKIIVAKYGWHFRQALNIRTTQIDNYRLIAWYGFALHSQADDANGVILMVTLQILNDHLKKEGAQLLDRNSLNTIYRMGLFRAVKGMQHFSVNAAGVFLAFWTASIAVRLYRRGGTALKVDPSRDLSARFGKDASYQVKK